MRILAFAVPVIIGIALLVSLVMTRQGPHQAALEERSTPVRVINVPRVDMVPRARAYGTVQPGRSWDAVAEVGGTVVTVNPKLKSGAFLEAGSVLLGIDPTDYELAIAQRRADIAATNAKLLDNEVREANSRRSLAIENQALTLSGKELERRRRLARQGAASQSGVEQQEREVLVQRQNVISHENTLALLPPERKSLEAQLARYEAQLAEAEHNLQRATIRLPFDARIFQVHVEKNQSVRPGEVLLVADDIATAEIEARVPMQVVRNIMTTGAEPVAALPENVGEVFGITARVRLPDFDIEWPARLVRMSATLDPETRTIGAIVVVEEPYRGVIAGIRPPLVKEMFVEVDLRGQPRQDSIVIPRTAVHEGNVYVVDEQDRLRIQPVETSLVQPDFVAITKGVTEGDRLVISQLIPAVQGMRLVPHADEAALDRLIRAAKGNPMIRFFAGHPTAANLLMAVFLLAGLASLPDLRRETLPDFAPEEVEVKVDYPGASSEDIEESICLRVEDALSRVSSIEEIRCDAKEGVGVIVAKMREGFLFDGFLSEIRTEVDAIDTFPDATEAPIITQLGRIEPVVSVAVQGPMSETDLKALAEDLKRRLRMLPSVSMVSVDGFSQHQLRVQIYDEALRKYGISINQIADTIARQSVDLPAGIIQTMNKEILVRFVEQRRSPSELGELVVIGKKGNTGEVRLADIATIEDRFELDEARVLFDGERAALLRIEKNKDEDALVVMDAVRDFVERERQLLPSSVELTLTEDVSSIVRDRLQLLVRNGWQGMVLVFIVMWFFFRLRLSFWVTMGLPVSFLGGLFFMGLMGSSINMITMVALIMALGLVMDDAIVIAENVAAHLGRGKEALEAAVQGVTEVMPGVLASFFTTAAVFVPLAFLSGDIGKVLQLIPVVLIVVLAVSLVEAFLILPNHLAHALAGASTTVGRFRRAVDNGVEWFRSRVLGRSVDGAVRYRYAFVGVLVAVCLGTVGLVAGGYLKFQAFPDLEGDTIEARVLLPQGTPLWRTEEVVARLKESLNKVDERFSSRQPGGQRLVQNVGVHFNKNLDAHEKGPHVVTVTTDLLAAEIRVATIEEIVNEWRDETGSMPDVLTLSFKEPVIGPAGLPIEIRLQGTALDTLGKASLELRNWLTRYRGVFDVHDDLRPGKPELRIRLRDGALALGLDASDIANQVRASFQGTKAADIQVGPESIEVDVRLHDADKRSLDDLEYFRIITAGGARVPLRSVASVTPARGYARIHRINGQRTVTVVGDVDTRLANAAEILDDTRQRFLPELKQKYPEVRVSFEGASREAATTGKSILRGFLIGMVLVFLLLSFQFRSYLEPLVVLAVLPMAFIGVIWGHLVMGLELSMPSMMGFASLGGVVVNDSILLVDFLKRRVADVGTVAEAARLASRDRFRAVLLTSLTTIAGLTPLLAEKSLQAQVLIPLATSIVFGLLASTLLVLLAVPALYTILDDLKGQAPKRRSAS